MSSDKLDVSANPSIWAVLQQRRSVILIFALCFLVSVLVELLDMGLSVDIHIQYIEIAVYGIVLPSIALLILNLLARQMAQRTQQEEILKQQHSFTRQLTLCQGRDELARFVVRYAASILPIDHASFFIYEHRQAKPELVTAWNAIEGLNSPVNRYLSTIQTCSACLRAQAPRPHPVTVCGVANQPSGARVTDEYCQPFTRDGLLVGALFLHCRPGQPLPPGEVNFMESVASEITVALALSIAQPRQMDLARLEAQVAERRRIIQQLHDSLAQQVFFLHLGLDQMIGDETLHLAEASRRKLERMRDVSSEVYEQIRDNLSLLRTWEEAGFSQAIAGLAQSVAQRTGLKIDVTSEGETAALVALNFQQAFALMREGLNNIEKHARARNVQIALTWATDQLTINIADDGAGFDPDLPPRPGHYGLVLMRETAKALHGECQINSHPGQGTQVCFRIPLRPVGLIPFPFYSVPLVVTEPR